jgi:hypothetical protein
MATKIEWDVAKLSQDVKQAAVDALVSAGEYILDESNKIAPIDEGTLIRSGNVAVDENAGTVIVYYDTPYAVRQHEDMSLRHTNGRSAKFLEIASTQNADKVRKFIEDAVNKAVS